MNDSAPAPDDRPAPPAPPDAAPQGWQPLPRRARRMFVLGNLLGFGLLTLALLVPVGLFLHGTALALPAALAALVLVPGAGVWLAFRRHACTRWRLDEDGYALRRGRLWQLETFVPRSRVQHLDIQRGPIERRFGLATLVIHTAGTRASAVSTAGLAGDDAEWLRDRLAGWIERDDDEA